MRTTRLKAAEAERDQYKAQLAVAIQNSNAKDESRLELAEEVMRLTKALAKARKEAKR